LFQSAYAETVDNLISYALKINCGTSQGAGFRLNPEVIVTAKHVVEKCKSVSISDNEGLLARSDRLIFSSDYDIAYIFASDDIGRIVKISEDAPKVGEIIYTVGSPIDGLVLSKGRLVSSFKYPIGDWIEISIAADQGNSGGPVFSTTGLVGMVISKNLMDDTINAYSIQVLQRDYENLGKNRAEGNSSNSKVIANDSSSPLLTQSISAIIAFVFGAIAGNIFNQRRQRRLRKKRIRIQVEN
jgi:hypothetical protein